MEDLKKLKVKIWKEIAKNRRTGRDLAEKAKTHKELQCQMMMMIISGGIIGFDVYQTVHHLDN